LFAKAHRRRAGVHADAQHPCKDIRGENHIDTLARDVDEVRAQRTHQEIESEHERHADR